jgi:hypothetical protein
MFCSWLSLVDVRGDAVLFSSWCLLFACLVLWYSSVGVVMGDNNLVLKTRPRIMFFFSRSSPCFCAFYGGDI